MGHLGGDGDRRPVFGDGDTDLRRRVRRRQRQVLAGPALSGVAGALIGQASVGVETRCGDRGTVDVHGVPADARARHRQGIPANTGVRGQQRRIRRGDDRLTHLAELRAVRINMEFNGALCRGLKQVRYREKSAADDRLSLVDFLPAESGRCGSAARS